MLQEKKGSNKKVIALAVICVILIASLIGVFAIYQPTTQQSQIAQKDQTIASLQSQLASLQEQISQYGNSTSTYILQIAALNEQIAEYNATLAGAQQNLATANSILALGKSGILYQGTFSQEANTVTAIYSNALDYAGYVIVEIQATANTTYAQVSFPFGDGGIFNYNVTVGNSGTALLPVLPATVQISIGNVLQTGGTNSVNATATYYY